MFDLQVAFFKPLWIRIAVSAFCLGWAAVELATGSPFWALLFGALGVYCVHQFFIAFDPKGDDPD